MSKNHERSLSPSDRWVVFAGVPMAVNAVLFANFIDHHGDLRGVSEKAAPWVFALVELAVIVAGRELYHRLPQEKLVPLGIAGYIFMAMVLCWYFWIGPGVH